MKRFILFPFILFACIVSGQTNKSISSLLDGLTGKSENISGDSSVKRFLATGDKVLPDLAMKFTDTKASAVFSDCVDRYLTMGELAIILADHIEAMPYYHLTGTQNCTLESCENNPNFVEYYLESIRFRGATATFQQRYLDWLKSPERRKYRN